MSHNPERYKTYTEVPTGEAVIALREYIGELPDLRQPTSEEVYSAIETVFPALSEKEKSRLRDAFMQSELNAEAEADRLAEQSE